MIRLAAVLVLLPFLAPAPAAADEEPYVDLVVTAAFDKAAYLSSDEIRLTLTITNRGTVPATGVRIDSRTSFELWTNWGEAEQQGGAGVRVEPGEQLSFTAATRLMVDVTDLWYLGRIRGNEADRDLTDNNVHVTATSTLVRGDIAGFVYGDGNGNGVADPGEALGGIPVQLADGNANVFGTRTDATGRFSFTDLPALSYFVLVTVPGGWWFEPEQQHAVGTGEELVARAVRAEPPPLLAGIRFDRDTYASGDTVLEHVTLTNTGTADLTGLVAVCGSMGDEHALFGAGWGDLLPDGPGITLRAGETRTFTFRETVPEEAWRHGFVFLRCDFTTSPMRNGVVVEARARVPGGRGSYVSTLYHDADHDWTLDADEQRPAGVTLVLLERASGRVVARAVSTPDGRFAFPDVPAEVYELRIVGPWRLRGEPPTLLAITAGSTGLTETAVYPGPSQPDPEAPAPSIPPSTPSTPATPAPQARPASPTRLADTGASVAEPLALGVLLLVAGIGLLSAVRSRRTS